MRDVAGVAHKRDGLVTCSRFVMRSMGGVAHRATARGAVALRIKTVAVALIF
jgi:hypothetical protein